jgi:hypothetical protein
MFPPSCCRAPAALAARVRRRKTNAHPPTRPKNNTTPLSRAERFGVQYVDPARARPDMRLEARRERNARSGFVTGIDFFSAEEEQKRKARAAKFGLADDGGTNGILVAGGGPLLAPPKVDVHLDPDDDPAELARRRARAERFGVPLAPLRPPQQRVGAHGGGGGGGGGLMDVDALEAPADAPADAAPRPEAVYLYGVDLMSTGDCLRYFTEYGPTFVEWINDSACVVLFADGGSAARAMHGTGVALPPEAPGAAEGEQQQQPAEGEEGAAAVAAMDGGEVGEGAGGGAAAGGGVVWFRGRDFVKAGTAVRLLYRAATQADRRDLNAPKPPSRYLWKAVAGAGSKRGRDGPGGGGGRREGGGGGGDRRFPPNIQHGGRGRRRRMDGSYEEVDMADADGGGDMQEGGGGGMEGGGGGEDGGGHDGGPRRRVRVRRRGGRGPQQDEAPWQEGGGGGHEPQQQQYEQQGGQQDGGEGGQQRRGGRGRRMHGARRPRRRDDGFLEV